MANFRPMRIPGRWREGFALDYHTLGSTYVGDDQYGHPVFDTKRTEVGELIYRLKYCADNSVVDDLVQTMVGFLQSWKPVVQAIIPVPPTRSARPRQPVHLLSQALGNALGIAVIKDCVRRVKAIPELKDIYAYHERLRLLEGAHTVERPLVEGQNVLLLDDLYRSGATMNAITQVLYDLGHAGEVYALAVTRTRSKS